MYIPDSIRIVATDQHALVFSNDTPDQKEDAIPTRSVHIYYDGMGGLSAQVTFGSLFRRIEESASKSITVTYDADHVALDIRHA